MALFVAKDVSKIYSGHVALDKVSIEVPKQSIFGLLGPNGAGKTSLIRIINRITGPDEGELFFDQEKLQQKHINRIGYLPEERGLYRKMKVGEHALYLARLKGLSKKEATRRLKEWFEKFGIEAWWYKKVEELSKGMQQKVQFIVTILHEPELLIFDEPFSGFDPINVSLLKEEILKIRDKGATIIFSTHNMESVEELCDHIALIDRSQKVLDGRVSEIKQKYATRTFRITFNHFNGDMKNIIGDDFSVVKESEKEGEKIADIQLGNGVASSDLILKLAPHGNIQSFNEVVPTMNDIFIRVVKENGSR
jgi:ABC-2 type transport system ATP-binding protein